MRHLSVPISKNYHLIASLNFQTDVLEHLFNFIINLRSSSVLGWRHQAVHQHRDVMVLVQHSLILKDYAASGGEYAPQRFKSSIQTQRTSAASTYVPTRVTEVSSTRRAFKRTATFPAW
jgi:hypothetical protein